MRYNEVNGAYIEPCKCVLATHETLDNTIDSSLCARPIDGPGAQLVRACGRRLERSAI